VGLGSSVTRDSIEPDDAREQARLARKQRRQASKRSAILLAARELLAEGGPAALTMSALAGCADTSPSTLYYYLPSREAVVDALAAELVLQETEVMLAAMQPEHGGVDALVAVMEARVALFLHDPARFGALYMHLVGTRISASVLREHVYPQSARVMGELARRLAADQEAGRVHPDLSPRAFANVGFFAVQGILTTALGIEASGGALRFPVETLLSEAVATVRRAAAVTITPRS